MSLATVIMISYLLKDSSEGFGSVPVREILRMMVGEEETPTLTYPPTPTHHTLTHPPTPTLVDPGRPL
jgi:hypothetical protein